MKWSENDDVNYRGLSAPFFRRIQLFFFLLPFTTPALVQHQNLLSRIWNSAAKKELIAFTILIFESDCTVSAPPCYLTVSKRCRRCFSRNLFFRKPIAIRRLLTIFTDPHIYPYTHIDEPQDFQGHDQVVQEWEGEERTAHQTFFKPQNSEESISFTTCTFGKALAF